MSFKMKKTLEGGSRRPIACVLADSLTFIVGEGMKSYGQTDGSATHATAAVSVLGVLVGIVDKYGIPIVASAITAGTAADIALTTVTTGASNVTNSTYWGLIDTSRNTVYTTTVSGTLGTTAQSNKRGCRIDIDSANTNYARVLESTATRTIGTAANFYSHGLDKDDSTRLLLSIALSEYDSDQE